MIKHLKKLCGFAALCFLLNSGLPDNGLLGSGFTATQALAQSADEVSKPSTFTALNYLTGWSHDSAGYHPAVFILLENTSAHDLTNRTIKFQARFTDLNTAEVTIGRHEIRRDLKPHQQFNLVIQGSQGYELPMEAHLWPSIEAKVMSRISSSDDGTETVLISKVDSVARTEDDAIQSLNQATSYNPNRHHNTVAPADKPRAQQSSRSGPRELVFQKRAEPEKPLIATAGRLAKSSSAMSLLSSKILPALGADFYNFEQRFGLPVATEATHADWTLAKYRHAASATDIVTGSRRHSSKVDLIIIKVPRTQALDGLAIVNVARQLPAHVKAALPSPTRSVRYLAGGRVELVISAVATCKVICLTTQNAEQSDNSFILVMSRLPQDVEPMLAVLSRRSALLSFVRFLDSNNSAQNH